jgi:hypothetical protein
MFIDRKLRDRGTRPRDFRAGSSNHFWGALKGIARLVPAENGYCHTWCVPRQQPPVLEYQKRWASFFLSLILKAFRLYLAAIEAPVLAFPHGTPPYRVSELRCSARCADR